MLFGLDWTGHRPTLRRHDQNSFLPNEAFWRSRLFQVRFTLIRKWRENRKALSGRRTEVAIQQIKHKKEKTAFDRSLQNGGGRVKLYGGEPSRWMSVFRQNQVRNKGVSSRPSSSEKSSYRKFQLRNERNDDGDDDESVIARFTLHCTITKVCSMAKLKLLSVSIHIRNYFLSR